MKALFSRAKDDQKVIRVIPDDSNEQLLLEDFVVDAGKRAWVVVQGDKTVLLYPKQPQ